MQARLGAEADRMILRASVGNMAEAVVLDACATCAIEQVCDNFCLDFEAARGGITRRFSPGYGDVPLDMQKHFDAVLKLYRNLGVSITEGGLMTPQKSVTAIFGISAGGKAAARSCSGCPCFDKCNLRKEGIGCGK